VLKVLFLVIMITFCAGSGLACTMTETSVTGDSMQGLLWDKQKITVFGLDCGEPNRLDHLLFSNEETPNAVVKQIWGFPGDTLRIGENGHVFINEVRARTPYGKPYKLIGFARKKMKKLQGELVGGYLVLGHPGSLDSARVGLIPAALVLGFVKKDTPHIAF
jgi:signal peptidase I